MKNWKVEVYYKPEFPDTLGQQIFEDIIDLGITGLDSVRTATSYWIEGTLDAQTIDRISTELLADPITQTYTVTPANPSADRISTELLADPITQTHTGTPVNPSVTAWTIEVQFKPGVTDAVGDSAVKGISDLGITGITNVRTGHKYWITGALLNTEIIETIAHQLLMNDVIQTYSYQEPEL